MATVPFAVWAAAVVGAQESAKPAVDNLTLIDLRVVLDRSVYALDALQNAQSGPRLAVVPIAKGSNPRLFAGMHDACFDGEGCLTALVVVAPLHDPRDVDPWRTLPAPAVRWHTAGPLWALVSPTMQLQELARLDAQPPNVVAPAETWLASRLLQAPLQARTVASPVGKDAIAPVPTASLRIWMAPDLQRLVMVVVPIPLATENKLATHRHVVVPWSLVRLTGKGDSLRIGLATTPELLAAAPACEPAEPPNVAMRRFCYSHFAVGVPSWDTLDGQPSVAAVSEAAAAKAGSLK